MIMCPEKDRIVGVKVSFATFARSPRHLLDPEPTAKALKPRTLNPEP